MRSNEKPLYTCSIEGMRRIDSEDTLKETISSFSGPVGLRPPAETSIQMSSRMANEWKEAEITPEKHFFSIHGT